MGSRLIADLQTLAGRANGLKEIRGRGMMVAVLRHRQRALGILQIRSRSAVAFTPSDLRTLEAYKAFRLEAEAKGFRHFRDATGQSVYHLSLVVGQGM